MIDEQQADKEGRQEYFWHSTFVRGFKPTEVYVLFLIKESLAGAFGSQDVFPLALQPRHNNCCQADDRDDSQKNKIEYIFVFDIHKGVAFG